MSAASAAPVTLGVMARAPVPGRCKTRLARRMGADRAAALYAAMLADRIAAVSVLPAERRVIVAAPEDDGVAVLRAFAPPGWELLEQRGEDLGARLTNAFRDLLPRAGGGIVHVMDTDSPTLPLAELWPELCALRSPRDVVLGPCDDGGYYLIGMRAFEPGIFEGIPWSTEGVATATRARCDALGLTVVDLMRWYDVDEHDDVERLARELAPRPAAAPRTAAILGEIGS